MSRPVGNGSGGVTIYDAALMNAAAYGGLGNLSANPPVSIDGYTVVAVVPQNAAGFGATEFKNDTTGAIYVAMIGTTANFGSAIADLVIALQADPIADADALAFVSNIVANNPDATVQIGGHSLGGQEAAFVSSETGLSALVENAPDPAGTTAGPFGDGKVLQINALHDIVGNDGDFFTNTVTLDTGAGFFNQFGTLGTHKIDGLNDILSVIPSLGNQELSSYSLSAASSQFIVSITDSNASGFASNTNPDGSTTFTSNDGSQETVSLPDANGNETFSGTFPAADGAPQGTFQGTINVNTGAISENDRYSDGTTATYTDDGNGNTVTTNFDKSGALISTTDGKTTNDDATGTATTTTQTFNAAGILTEASTTDSNGSSTDTTYTYNGTSTILNTTDFANGAETGTVIETITANPDGGTQSVTDIYVEGVLQSETTQTVDPNGNSSSVTTNAAGTKTGSATDDGGQAVSDTYDPDGQVIIQTTQNDAGTANPDYSSTTLYSYNSDGTLAKTTATDSDGIQTNTNYFYGADSGSTTANQSPYGVSTDTTATSGNTVTNDFQFTDTASGAVQATTTVTTTNPADSSQTVNTTNTVNGAVASTETAAYNGNGGLVQDNVTNFQDGSVSSTSSIANTYDENGQLQQGAVTTTSGTAIDTNTSQYTYYASGAVNQVTVSEDYSGSDGSFHSQTTSVYSQDGDQIASNNSFDGSGSFAPQPSPPDSGSDSGGGGYDSTAGSDGSGGSSDGGGYSFVGGRSTPSGGTNSNIGVISQYDLNNGSPIAGLIAQIASSQAYAAITASQTSSASKNAVLEGAAWDTKVVTWSFASGSGPAAAPFSNSIVSQYQATVEQAFAAWGSATGITFEEVSDSSSSDIRVGWGDFQTATSGVAGYTNYQSTNGAMNGAIVRLEDPTQDPLIVGATGQLTYEGTNATLLQVAEHEIGHALGFADNSDPSSIMYAVASSTNQAFDATDLAGIAQVYGGSSIPSQTALASTGSSDETYYNATHQLVISDTINPDGSTSDVSYSYNSDGSYVETVVATSAGSSTAATSVYDINAQGQITGEQISSPGIPTIAYTYNSAGQLLTADVTNADGSTNNVSYNYNGDGSYVETAVATPAGGGTPTTTVYNVNAQGGITREHITNPDGSTITYTYNTAGQLLTDDVTNADGSTNDVSSSYNGDGSYVETAVATPAGGGTPTTTVYNVNAQGEITRENITNPDGSTITYTYNSAGQLLTDDVSNADGSTNDVSYGYNGDGSYVETAVATPAGGGAPTTTVYNINAQGQVTSEHIANPDGSTITYTYNSAGQLLTDDVTNADGSTNDVSYSYNSDGSYVETAVATPAGGGAPTTTVYDINAQGQTSSEHITNPDGSTITYTYNAAGQLLTDHVTNADGSTNDVSYSYNGDGSYVETAVATPAGGGATTTTVYDINAQGQITSENITNPDGSTITYTYNSAGQLLTDDVKNADGSTNDVSYSYNGDGSYIETAVATPAGGGTPTTTVYDVNAQGQITVEDGFQLRAGVLSTNVASNQDGSLGTYWWNTSTRDYLDVSYGGGDRFWLSEYPHANNGSSGSAGSSLAETSSETVAGSGMQQFDAVMNPTTLSWDLARAGTISSANFSDSGLVGFVNYGELTKTPTDLTLFPHVRPEFNIPLNEHH